MRVEVSCACSRVVGGCVGTVCCRCVRTLHLLRRGLVLGCSSLVAVGCERNSAPSDEGGERTVRAPLSPSGAGDGDVLAKACGAAVEREVPVLLEFSAEWCPDCKTLQRLATSAPLREELSRWQHVTIDIDDDAHDSLTASVQGARHCTMDPAEAPRLFAACHAVGSARGSSD
jgi:thiol-disulfide isomerase/thioredoxin